MSISANFPNVQPSLLLDFANAKQLPPSVNFTRATTAAYYDGSTTAMAEQNLQIYSQEFNSWTGNLCSVTANTTAAPDGTTTADTVAQTVTSGEHYLYRSDVNCTIGVPVTLSIYAKNVDQNYIQFSISNNSLYANFDLSSGVVGSSYLVTSSSITSVGSGWYRCVVTVTPGASGFFFIGFINSASAGRISIYTPASATSVYLWGAQIEQRSAVTAYTATSTQQITNYIPVLLTAGGGQPRFDHNPTTSESLGLLIEDQRTNLLLYSSQFNTSPWTGYDSGFVTANQNIAPDGTLSADTWTTGGSSSIILQNVSGLTANSNVSFSIYLKRGNTDWAFIRCSRADGTTYGEFGSYFNIASGTVGSAYVSGIGILTSATIQAVGNGWYRCTIIGYNPAGTTGYGCYAAPASGNGTGTTAGLTMFLWGAQMENAGSPTSYIPTTSASATRAADLMYYSGASMASWFSNDEGTVFMDCVPNSSTGYLYAFSDGTGNNRWQVDVTNTSVGLYDAVGGTAQVSFGFGNITVGTQFKIAAAFQNSDFAATLNAGSVSNQTSGLVPPMTFAYIGTSADGNANAMLKGWIKKFAYYPQRVTNAQLQALTS